MYFMPKQRQKYILERILLGIAAVFLLGVALAPGFLPDLSAENRAPVIILGSAVVLICTFGVMFLGRIRRWVRRYIWLRTMNAWVKSTHEGKVPEFDFAQHLSHGGLKHLAMQIYSRMGYDVMDREENEVDRMWVKMVNPEGRIELVYCEQSREPLGIAHVHKMQLALKRENAVRGYIWAPGGFSSEAIHWVKNRPIVLADNHGIGRFVESLRKTSIASQNLVR
jgi:hypothetical protein